MATLSRLPQIDMEHHRRRLAGEASKKSIRQPSSLHILSRAVSAPPITRTASLAMSDKQAVRARDAIQKMPVVDSCGAALGVAACLLISSMSAVSGVASRTTEQARSCIASLSSSASWCSPGDRQMGVLLTPANTSHSDRAWGVASKSTGSDPRWRTVAV